MASQSYDSCVTPCPAKNGMTCPEAKKNLQYARLSDAAYGLPIDAPLDQRRPLQVGDNVDGFKVDGKPPPENDPDTNFHAYTLTNPDTGETVVTFRGSVPPSPNNPGFTDDWVKTNALNELGGVPEQYQQAADYAAAAQKENGPITITGHSKGGGEGAYAALQTGQPATLFNAAPLGLGSRLESMFSDTSKIQNVNVTGEVLSNPIPGFSGPDVLRTVLAAITLPVSAVASLAILATGSKQVGQKTFIPPSNPATGTLDRHAMSTVLSSLEKVKEDVCPK